VPGMATLKTNLLDASDHVWQRFRHRLDGLTDHEYVFEPVPDCWSVRLSSDGTYRMDGTPLPPDPAPFTTIAWRVCHIIDNLQAERTATWLGLTPRPDDGEPTIPGTATEALNDLDRAYAIWRNRLGSVSDDAFGEVMGDIAGPYANYDRAAFALHILDELIHHGAEVSLVRDFYRQRALNDPFVQAAMHGDRDTVSAIQAKDSGALDRTLTANPELLSRAAALQRWDAVRLLVELGFGVNVASSPPAPSPLHYAAGAGELDVVRLLLDHGADPRAIDPSFQQTPLGWAGFFRRDDVVTYLKGIEDREGT
jgi:hypothetical protein